MILAQCNSAENTLAALARFSKEWMIVEYMPYGLAAKPVPYPPPEAYSKERFENAFRAVAEITQTYQVEPTRVLYVGRLRKDRQEHQLFGI